MLSYRTSLYRGTYSSDLRKFRSQSIYYLGSMQAPIMLNRTNDLPSPQPAHFLTYISYYA